jgi:hypothetical protein
VGERLPGVPDPRSCPVAQDPLVLGRDPQGPADRGGVDAFDIAQPEHRTLPGGQLVNQVLE